MNYKKLYHHRHWFINLSLAAIALILLTLFVFYIIPRILPETKFSNTKRNGIIFQDEVWSGVITITGDIWSVPGAKVTVVPGTKILVSRQDNFNLNFSPWDLRSGMNLGKESFGVKNGELFRDPRKDRPE